MKLERFPEYFITALILLIGLGVSIFVGVRLGTGNIQPVVLVAGAICFLAIGAALGRHVWLLIPFSLYGAPRILDLPISMGQAGAITAFFWWVIFVAFKQVKMKNRWGATDYIMWLNVLYLVALYIRQPFGGLFFGSDIIGIMPYFMMIFALMSYWVMTRVELTEVWARRLPWVMVIGTIPALVAVLAIKVAPGVSPVTEFVLGVGLEPEIDGGGAHSERYGFLAQPIMTVMCAIFAYYPIRTLVNPLYIKQMLIMCAGMVLLLFTGFRNQIASAGLYFLMIAYYREGLGRVFRVSLLAVPVLAVILAGHGTLYTFPFAVQRSLSFLPGKWDEEPLSSAKDSSLWRYEMWELMFEDTKYLKDRWFGDGFGYSAQELLDRSMTQTRFGQYELYILTGNVHSGPYSAIRYAGYVGLGLIYILMFALVIKSHRLILKSKGTPYEFPALVIGVPTIAQPFLYTFVFGAYNNNFSICITLLAFLKMIENGLAIYRRKEHQALLEAQAETARKAKEEEVPPVQVVPV